MGSPMSSSPSSTGASTISPWKGTKCISRLLSTFRISTNSRKGSKKVVMEYINRGAKLNSPLEKLITFTCEICTDVKLYSQSFSIKGCAHSYCSDCVIKYIDSKLEHNVVQISCPGICCSGTLNPDHCRSIISDQVFDKWWTALHHSFIPLTCKLYCSYNDCSALLISSDTITHAMMLCPYCQRCFCVNCKVSWHQGIECEEFQRLKKDVEVKEELLLFELAQTNGWKQCPKCNIYIERVVYEDDPLRRCDIMSCRSCGCGFCYGCGTAYGARNGHFSVPYCFRRLRQRRDVG